VRHGLNVESGLNDGMVLPFFVLFLAAIPGTHYAEEDMAGGFWRALVLSTALGLLVGGLGGRLLQWSWARSWVTREWRQVYLLAVAGASYGLAVVADGSGFIAAWVAGFACGFALRRYRTGGEKEGPDRTADFAENLGGLLASISLLIFGAVLLGPALEHLNWRIIVYAVLSLTLVRMVPVALSLAGGMLRLPTVAYIGWFGPRGLASVVLALLVVEEHVPGMELVARVVAITVGLSVLLHGVSAVVLAERYGRWYEKAAAISPDLREGTPTPETPGVAGPARWTSPRREGAVGPLALRRAGSRAQCPDDEGVDGDQHDRPERCVRQPQEVRDHAEAGQQYTHDPGPCGALKQGHSSENDHGPQDQMDPAPSGEVELEDVVTGGDEHVVVRDGGDARENGHQAAADHHDCGEHQPAAATLRHAARSGVAHLSRHDRSFVSEVRMGRTGCRSVDRGHFQHRAPRLAAHLGAVRRRSTERLQGSVGPGVSQPRWR